MEQIWFVFQNTFHSAYNSILGISILFSLIWNSHRWHLIERGVYIVIDIWDTDPLDKYTTVVYCYQCIYNDVK